MVMSTTVVELFDTLYPFMLHMIVSFVNAAVADIDEL